MSNLRASEPLGGGLRASGPIEEVGGLALVFAAVVMGVLCVLAVAWLVVWFLLWLGVRVGHLLAWLWTGGPRVDPGNRAHSKSKF